MTTIWLWNNLVPGPLCYHFKKKYIFRTNREKEEKNYTMQYNMVMVVKKSFSDHCGKNYN